MADSTFLAPEPMPRDIAGGRTRTSVLVDMQDFPAVAHRLDLNARLLDRTCPFGSDGERSLFTLDDLDVLLLATDERFGAEAALLRHQAVVALGTLDSDIAIRKLIDLATDPVEHDGIRISALTALPKEQATELLDGLVADTSETVGALARKLRDGPTERPPVPAHVALDSEGDLDGCRCHACCH